MSWMNRTRERIRTSPGGGVLAILLFAVIFGFLVFGAIQIQG